MKTITETTAMAAIGVIGGVIGGIIVTKMIKDSIASKKVELNETIEDAKKRANDISDQVDTAVRFVYDNEAKSAFERKLRTINLEEVSANLCKEYIKKLDDTMLRKMIRETYDSQIKSTMRDELKSYFEEGIKRFIDSDIDTEFIRKTAKAYIRDEVKDVLIDEIKEAIDDCNVEQKIEIAIARRDISRLVSREIERFDCTYLFEDKVGDLDFDKIAEKVVKEAIDGLDLKRMAEEAVKNAN